MSGVPLSVGWRLGLALRAAWAIFWKLGEYRVVPGDTISHVHEIRVNVEE